MRRIGCLVLGLWLGVGLSATARSAPPLPPGRSKHYTGGFSWQDDLVIGRLRQLQPQILINDRTSMPADWRTREGADRLGGFDNVQPCRRP